MSWWTHIVAAIDIDTYIRSKTIKSDVEELLKGAPEITGSEGNADIFVNVLSGTNISTNCDCGCCEYGETIKHLDEGGWICDASDGYQCPRGEYQTRVVVTVIGDLRDRQKSQTEREWLNFKNFIEKKIRNDGFTIRNCACNIEGW